MTDLKPNLIYDVGLHLGEDTDFYLSKGFNVIALEANPQLASVCRARFERAITSGQLRVIEGAIAPSSAGHSVTFYRNLRASIWGTVDAAWAERNAKEGFESETIELPRVDIGDVYRKFGIPFYLKVDIEGVDRLALSALKQFEARPRYISIESEKVDFDELCAELSLLRDLGYSKFKVVQQSTVPGSSVRTRRLDGGEFEYVFEMHASGPFGDDIPQPWLNFEEAHEAYARIFESYRRYGDTSRLGRSPALIRKLIKKSYRMFTGRALPGWHDTHASL